MNDDGESTTLEGPERLLGSRVLDFELKSILGAGGMSTVYRGVHRVTGQEVAVKILPPELATHDELKARFVEEARVMSRLEHPGIVHLNNFTEAGGRLCLIMQFVDGVTFEDLIERQGRLPADEASRVCSEVLRALEYAHGQNVVHRDIKPSNILVRPDGGVKVTDFGIAKILGQSRLTTTGQTMGTVRYMSPEQVRGRPADARSDLYSLGATLYEALAGRTPFDGQNHFEVMQKHIDTAPPPLATFGARVSPALEAVVMRALEKDPDARYPDAHAFRLELDAAAATSHDTVAQGLPSGLRRAPRAASSGRRLNVAAALGLTVATAGIAGAVYSLLHMPKTGGAAAPAPVPPSRSRPQGDVAAWPAPHVVPGGKVVVDEKFVADGLRVQSWSPRDARALARRYRDVRRVLAKFLATSDTPAARAAASAKAPPLNLVVVPQEVLNRAELWPGYRVAPDSTYPSRYVEPRRTLFVADSSGFERRDLPYGVALHVLAPVRALSDAECLALAEKFEAAYLAEGAP